MGLVFLDTLIEKVISIVLTITTYELGSATRYVYADPPVFVGSNISFWVKIFVCGPNFLVHYPGCLACVVGAVGSSN
jgi:hypothetical protein